MGNWNHQCAECHSTNLRKGYDAATDRFETTWSEIDVSCEACHGPGSAHVAWAETRERGVEANDPARGLVIRLKDHDNGRWVFSDDTGIAKREPPRTSRTQVETCARCHARRSPIAEYGYGRPLADTHRPAVFSFAGVQHMDDCKDQKRYDEN